MLRRLDAVRDEVSLVVLEAPPGYSKTTSVRQWVQSQKLPVQWVPVTSEHVDPGLLATAIAAGIPLVGEPELSSAASAGPGATPDQLASEVAAAARTRPMVLVLDGLEQAGGGGAPALVAALAASMPAGSRVVVTTDRPLPWRVGRLGAEGRYAEFGRDDLRFDESEVAAFVAAAGHDLPDPAVIELTRRTGGWPMGLRLALPLLAAMQPAAAAVWRLYGHDEVFAQYFRDEVLAGQPPQMLWFLRRTAVLERVSGPLCDSVLGTSGGRASLAEARARGLFVAPVDGTGEWYQFHPLFAQMLSSELRRSEPGTDLEIHRGAALWYEAAGQPETAVEHALEGRAAVVVARLIVKYGQMLNSQGRMPAVRRWLDQLDDDVIRGYPPLAPMAAWVWGLTGDADRARRALALAEAATFEGPLTDGSASLESAILRVRAALAPRGVEVMLVDAERAVALEPRGSQWHSMAALLLGVAQWLNEAPEEAVRSLESAQHYGASSQGPGASAALAQLAWLAARREDWLTAEACAHEASALIVANGLQSYMPSLLAYLVNAQVALHRGEADEATAWMGRALELHSVSSPAAFPWLAVQAAATLGHLQLELGDLAGAEATVLDAGASLRRLRPSGALARVVGDLARAVGETRRRAGLDGRVSLSVAEQRVLGLLPSHLSLAQIGDELVVSRNTVKGHVAAIYRKLGATNRMEAVRRARASRLLD